MNSFCSVLGHENNKLNFICVKENCNSQFSCCIKCINSLHKDHEKDCLKVSQLDTFLETQYKDLHQQIKHNIQEQLTKLEEKFSNIVILFKKYFTRLHEEISNSECIIIRKQQIVSIQRQKLVIEDNVIKVKSLLIEQQTSLDILAQQLEQQQKQIDLHQKKQNQQLNIPQVQSSEQLRKQNPIQFQYNPSNQQSVQKKKVVILDEDSLDDELEEEANINNNVQDLKINDDLIQQIQEEEFFFKENFEDQVIDYSYYENIKNQLKMTNMRFKERFDENFYQPSKISRIYDVVKNSQTFFANPQGYNVFAKDGIKVRISDIIIQEQKDFFNYLMYYLACFCPKQLQKLFITTDINYYGLYAVKMKNESIQVNSGYNLQMIDDFIPINSESMLQNINQICFLILRKAIAKYCRGYQFFQQYQFLQTLQTIFTFSVIQLKIHENNLIEMLQNEINCKSFILTSIRSKKNWMNSEEQCKVIQIVKIFPITTILNEQIYLVKIRCGYQNEFYQEEWTYDSPLWTDELFKTLEVDLDDDGIVYIEFMNFIQQVGIFYSIRLNSRLLIQEVVILRNNQSSYFQLDLLQDDNLAISIHVDDSQISYEDQYFQILISELNSNNFISSKFINRFCSTQQFFKKGKYVVFIKCPVMSSPQKQSIIQIYGQYPIKYQKIQKIEQYKQLVFDNRIEKIGKVLKTNGNLKILKLDDVENGWKVYKFLNLSQQKQEIQIICSQSDQVRLCKPFKSKQIMKSLSYNESFIIIMKIYSIQNTEAEILIQNQRINI